MYKNQLQELAQRSCFNLPSYACIREGPDHAPRFKASVNFNGEIFESLTYSTTLRQAEHAAAEVALNSLSARGPSKSLTARVLDETGVYKNLLQETAHRAGLKLPIYTTIRSGPGHVPVFTSTVELAGMSFTGEAAKTKKQAEKNAAIAAWSSLKRMPNLGPLSQTSKEMEQRREDHHHHYQRRDENRVIKRRDNQYQARGRMQRPQRENNLNSFAQKRPWKFMDTFSDPSLESCVQNQNNFLSLLPPPPPRTTPKILPPNFYQSKTSVSPMKMVGNSQVQEITPLPLDDNEWINKISEAIKKPPLVEVKGCRSSSTSHFYDGEIGTSGKGISILDFPKSSPQIATMSPFRVSSNCSNQMGMNSFNGGQRFAPAVQIRSVIPVCAAPPSFKETDPSLSLPPSAAPAPAPAPASSSVELASTLSKLKL